jgi:SAM-dependent methyltransferase
VTGLDAADALIAIAQARTPGGDFRVGEMEELPYPDGTFDVVTGINSFQYAANPVHALMEARRVARQGGLVVIAIWGRPEDCEATGYLNAIRSLVPPPQPGAPSPTAIEVDNLEEIARLAALKPRYSAEVSAPFHFPDLESALRGLNSSGPVQRAILASGEDKVREAVSRAIAPYKTPTRGYRMENKFFFLVTEV